MIKKKNLFTVLLFATGSTFSLAAPPQKNVETNQVIQEQMNADSEARKSQRTINSLADQTDTMLIDYRQTLQRIENARIYNAQLKKIIADQEKEKVSIAKQIETLKDTNQGIYPLMLRMAKVLNQFVNLDIPFLPEEREKRLADINELMNRADVSTSEKFRRVLEAYQVENEYGRTIEAYRGIQKRDGNDLTVDFLRVGRLALIYQTLDGSIAAMWDHKTKKWNDLGGEYKKSIREGIRMARKQTAPQLIKLPVATAGSN
jgi:predicted RND superfamily exporter protein